MPAIDVSKCCRTLRNAAFCSGQLGQNSPGVELKNWCNRLEQELLELEFMFQEGQFFFYELHGDIPF